MKYILSAATSSGRTECLTSKSWRSAAFSVLSAWSSSASWDGRDTSSEWRTIGSRRCCCTDSWRRTSRPGKTLQEVQGHSEGEPQELQHWRALLGSNYLWQSSLDFEVNRAAAILAKKERSKQRPASVASFSCSICGRSCASRIGLHSHMRTQLGKWLVCLLISRIDRRIHHDQTQFNTDFTDSARVKTWNQNENKGKDKSLSRVDSSVLLMHHDPNDLRSQIRFWILPKKTHP